MVSRIRRHPAFDISLQFKTDDFINPPREIQKNWLINRAISEFVDDLTYLDVVSKRLVPGCDPNGTEMGHDRSQEVLGEQQIMEDWQIPLMAAMARVVTETAGDVLEIGFGRGVSATYIQEFGVKSHTIVECNRHIINTLYDRWRKEYPHSNIRLIPGMWQDITDLLGVYDGIFFHTFVLNRDEFVKHVVNSVTFAEHFFPTAAEHLREGGVFTYLTNEIDSLSRAHQRLILKYFSSFALTVQRLALPENVRDLWWADSMVVVKAIK